MKYNVTTSSYRTQITCSINAKKLTTTVSRVQNNVTVQSLQYKPSNASAQALRTYVHFDISTADLSRHSISQDDVNKNAINDLTELQSLQSTTVAVRNQPSPESI